MCVGEVVCGLHATHVPIICPVLDVTREEMYQALSHLTVLQATMIANLLYRKSLGHSNHLLQCGRLGSCDKMGVTWKWAGSFPLLAFLGYVHAITKSTFCNALHNG